MRNKVILTDADGVLLDWSYAFDAWMTRHGHRKVDNTVYNMSLAYDMPVLEIAKLIRMFNESATIYNLPPLRDAIKYVRKLHTDHGYVFHCISSLSLDYNAQYLRTKNLKNLFGETVFEKFIYLDTGAGKDDVLKQYRDSDCFWIEDNTDNFEAGLEYGLDSMLMDHPFNRDFVLHGRRVSKWKDIYNIVTGEVL